MQEKKIAELLKKLLAAMKSALSDSDDVIHIVGEMETCGVKVMLVVDAVLQPMEQALWPAMPPNTSSEPQLKLSSDDVNWLKSLRIVSSPDQPNSTSSNT
jgi:hypothetical protein